MKAPIPSTPSRTRTPHGDHPGGDGVPRRCGQRSLPGRRPFVSLRRILAASGADRAIRRPEEALMRQYQLFIDGEFVDSADGQTFETKNPSDGSTITTVARAGRQDVDRAIDAARRAHDEGPWPRMTPAERSKVLMKVGELLGDRQSELSTLEAQDAGHTIRK